MPPLARATERMRNARHLNDCFASCLFAKPSLALACPCAPLTHYSSSCLSVYVCVCVLITVISSYLQFIVCTFGVATLIDVPPAMAIVIDCSDLVLLLAASDTR